MFLKVAPDLTCQGYELFVFGNPGQAGFTRSAYMKVKTARATGLQQLLPCSKLYNPASYLESKFWECLGRPFLPKETRQPSGPEGEDAGRRARQNLRPKPKANQGQSEAREGLAPRQEGERQKAALKSS